ncbi:UDP-N-acetylglucosamine 1-carboxyvinyltransferase [Candidatus Wolfebacteria bacterium RIFCSPLOWO2_01_FULL_45_19]|uniref:UDP-N-acetylglucosamine 1-carboxyvinyltransferase n=1 Tax=Candidatus Wolfebacteria bacterium RIFCSPLOWO2_01_FULL_45_19 TaxID=1802557 RepID=A0A1F8DUN3_9BACT|nr:MAG: UDP-N-acetylglucosamine 1-carboxyvinyltransferase [Candidatus Wolfebacteria bacterium RIFCSPLOWO2_01_FULL_45_19]
MAKFLTQGGRALNGEITLAGAKNAATKMLVASLLTDEQCEFENFPEIGDTEITAELCRTIGSEIKIKNNKAVIRTPRIKQTSAVSLSRKNRIPILTLGPLLARASEAEIPILGGDKIGPRPVDIHLEALRSMGAEIEATENGYKARAPRGLRGANLSFLHPSVGATENVILAATLAKGKTRIHNAAIEPEIISLIEMLQKMGAIIELGANRTVYVEGVEKLRGAKHAVIPDRNEAVSFACLAAATGGKIKIKGARQNHLITFLNAFRKIGGEYEVDDDGIIFWKNGALHGIEIETDAHPGFMTDWQQPFAILLTQAKGTSVIHETIYENRFGYAKDLNTLGANIQIFTKCLGELPCRFNGMNLSHSATIHGATPLRGSKLIVRDLRSGIAHVIAALVASGESVIEGIEEIDRGYEKIDERLRTLGAKIERIS